MAPTTYISCQHCSPETGKSKSLVDFWLLAKGPIWIQSPRDCDTSTKSRRYFSNFLFHIFLSLLNNCTSPGCQMHLGALQTSPHSKVFTFNVLFANKVLLVYFHLQKVCKNIQRKEYAFRAAFLYFLRPATNLYFRQLNEWYRTKPNHI